MSYEHLSPAAALALAADSSSNINSQHSFPLMQRRAVTGFFAGSEWGALLLTTNGAANIQLYQIDPQSFTLIKIAECYLGANIHGLERLRIDSNPKDYILSALEGGAILILEYNPHNVTFELVDQERYQSTFHPWLLWGRNMVSDWRSRCVVIGNVEDCKIVYILIDPTETKLSVALPTVDAIPTSVIYSLISVESSWRNPIFACLEAYCPDRVNTPTASNTSASSQKREEAIVAGDKMLVFYELDLEQNQVFRRWDVRVESTANLVIPVPCKAGTGSGGVLVCRRNVIQWLHERRAPQTVPVPRHPSLTLDVDVYLVSFTAVTFLPNSPQMILAQSIFGDLYLIEFCDDVLSIKFFDSVPQAEQLFLLPNRFLLAYSLFEYPRVYYLLSIGDNDPDQPIYTSLEQTEPEEAFFRPRPLRHLTSTVFLEQQQIARSSSTLSSRSRYVGAGQRRYNKSAAKPPLAHSASFSNSTTYIQNPGVIATGPINELLQPDGLSHLPQQAYDTRVLSRQPSAMYGQPNPNPYPNPPNRTNLRNRGPPPSYIQQHPPQSMASSPQRQIYSSQQERFVSPPQNYAYVQSHSTGMNPPMPATNMTRQSSLANRQPQLLVGGRTASLRRPRSHQVIQLPPAASQPQQQPRMVEATMLNKRYSSLRRNTPPSTSHSVNSPSSAVGGLTSGRLPSHVKMGTSLTTLIEENTKSVSRTTSIDSGYPTSIPAHVDPASNPSSLRSQSMPDLVHDAHVPEKPPNIPPILSQSPKDSHPDEFFDAVTTPANTNPSEPTPPTTVETAEKTLKQLELRSYVCTEVYETEISYRESLSIMLTQFKTPLEDRKLVPSVFIRLVFTGVQSLLDFSAVFASKLQTLIDEWEDTSSQLAPLFLAHRDDFSVFLKFVDNYSNALNMVRRAEESNEPFKQFNEKCKHSRDTNRQQLQDFLILPIQRATRYPLLLKDVRKHTPSDHPDMEGLTSALTMMNELAAQVNHVKQQEEEMTRMFAMFKHVEGCPPIVIKYSRRLIMEVDVNEVTGLGTVVGSVGLTALGNFVSSSKQHQFRLYLMSDLLLMARVHKKKTKFVRLIDLADLVVDERGTTVIALDIQQGSVSTSSTTLNAKVGPGKFLQSIGGAVRGVAASDTSSSGGASTTTRDPSLPSSYMLSLSDEKTRHNFMLAIGAKIKSTREQRAQEGGVFSLPRTAGAIPITSLSSPTVPPVTVPVASAVSASGSTSETKTVTTTTPVTRSPPTAALALSTSETTDLPPSSTLSGLGEHETKNAEKRTSFTLNVSALGTRSNAASVGQATNSPKGADLRSEMSGLKLSDLEARSKDKGPLPLIPVLPRKTAILEDEESEPGCKEDVVDGTPEPPPVSTTELDPPPATSTGSKTESWSPNLEGGGGGRSVPKIEASNDPNG